VRDDFLPVDWPRLWRGLFLPLAGQGAGLSPADDGAIVSIRISLYRMKGRLLA